MSESCSKVDAFFDGELSAGEAEGMRAHLASCGACARALHDRAMLEALVETHRPALKERPSVVAPRPLSRSAPTRFARWAPVIGALAIAASVAGIYLGHRGETVAPTVSASGAMALLDSPTRSVEIRLTYGPADRFRPYEVARGRAGGGDHISLEQLARLEREGELRGVAAGFALSGDLARASEYLARAGSSDDVDVDTAGIAIEQGEYERALGLLERVLKKSPGHPQARWNEAIALERLDLPFAAADAWDRVARLGEPGWSAEASQRATAGRAAQEPALARWKGAHSVLQDMVRTGALPPDDLVREFPSYVRQFLYLALAAAPSAAAVRSFEPLAAQLDAAGAGGPLSRYVAVVAGGDFARRARFVPRLREILAGGESLDDRGLRALLAQLRSASEPELAFALVNQQHAWGRFASDVYRAEALHDEPWIALVAARTRAYEGAAASDFPASERVLRRAIGGCKEQRFDYLCAALELQLSDMLLRQNKVIEAGAVASQAAERAGAQALGVGWNLEAMLAAIENRRGLYATMRVRLDDLLLRDPECGQRRYARDTLALDALLTFDVGRAREQVEAHELCGDPPSLERATALIVLRRLGVHEPDEETLGAALDAATRDADPGDALDFDVLKGVWTLERGDGRGAAMIGAAMEKARSRPGDSNAQGTRTWGAVVLAADAARRGDGTGVLRALADDASAIDWSCTLGAAADYERAFAAAANERGDVEVTYDDTLSEASDVMLRAVPERIRAHLSSCPTVHVLAPPPLHGVAELLPDGLAWAYRASGRREPPPAVMPPRRLVVSDVRPPAILGLPSLAGWGSAPAMTPAEGLWLHGAEATPGRVLDALGHATEVEIHAHGLEDPDVSDASLVVLSPDSEGAYALTAGALAKARLDGHPLVVLAACGAGVVAPYYHDTWSLPAAFLRAGARTVLASTQAIPDTKAAAFFDDILARVRGGAPASIALRDARVAWLARGGQEWVHSVIAFE